MVATVEQQVAADTSLQSLSEALKLAGFEHQLKTRKLSKEEQSLLGYRVPQSLGDVVKLLEARRCEPTLDEAVSKSASRLGNGKLLMINEVKWVGALDADAMAAARGVQEASLLASQAGEVLNRLGKPQKPAGAKENAAENVRFPPAPPSTLIESVQGRPTVVANPAFARWREDRAKFDRAREAAQQQQLGAQAAQQAVNDAKVVMNDRLKSLRWAIEMQTRAEGDLRYAVARLDLEGVTEFGDSVLYLPARCAQREVVSPRQRDEALGEGSVELLAGVRMLPEWSTLREVNSKNSVKLVDQMLISAEQSIEVLGFSVPERLATRVGPVLLFVTLLWHILYARRYRDLAIGSDPAKGVVSKLPDAPGHWILPVALALLVVTVCALLCRSADNLLDRCLIGVCMVAGIAAGMLTSWPIRPQTESNRDQT